MFISRKPLQRQATVRSQEKCEKEMCKNKLFSLFSIDCMPFNIITIVKQAFFGLTLFIFVFVLFRLLITTKLNESKIQESAAKNYRKEELKQNEKKRNRETQQSNNKCNFCVKSHSLIIEWNDWKETHQQ